MSDPNFNQFKNNFIKYQAHLDMEWAAARDWFINLFTASKTKNDIKQFKSFFDFIDEGNIDDLKSMSESNVDIIIGFAKLAMRQSVINSKDELLEVAKRVLD